MWHDGNKNTYGLVKHVVDSKAWVHFDATWPEFTVKPCNVILKFAIDGINPFGAQSCNWYTWPIMILVYNMSPWLII
jgi:hypothetical protein